MAAALHAQIGFRRSDQSQSSTLGQPTNGGPVLIYFLSETIHPQENRSRGTHFAKFLISNFLKGLTYSAMTVVAETVSRTLATFYFFNFLGFFGFGPFWSQIMGAMKKMETLVSVLIYQTLPKAQRTRGLSSYYKFLHKS